MGCLFGLFALPFKILYWIIKIVWEILEHLDRAGRRKRRQVAKPARSKRISSTRKSSDTPPRRDPVPQQLTKIVDEAVSIARSTHLSAPVRIRAYDTALEAIDQASRYTHRDKALSRAMEQMRALLAKERATMVTTPQ